MLPIQEQTTKATQEFKLNPLFPSSTLFSYMCLVTLALVYAKMSVYFYV